MRCKLALAEILRFGAMEPEGRGGPEHCHSGWDYDRLTWLGLEQIIVNMPGSGNHRICELNFIACWKINEYAVTCG